MTGKTRGREKTKRMDFSTEAQEPVTLGHPPNRWEVFLATSGDTIPCSTFGLFGRDTTSFIDDLQNINWNNICKHTDANQSFSRFYKCVNKTINKHAPLRSISNRKQKFLAKPWLTAGLRKSIRVKNNLFYTSDRDKYKFCKNKILRD